MQRHEEGIAARDKFAAQRKEKGMEAAGISLTLVSENAARETVRTPIGSISLEEYQNILDQRVQQSNKALSEAGVHVEYPPSAAEPAEALPA